MNHLIRRLSPVLMILPSALFAANTAPAATMPIPTAVAVTAPIVLSMQMGVPQEASETSASTPATATGSGTFLFNPTTDVLSYGIAYAGLSSAPTMAHFHFGAPTTNGPIVQTLCGMPGPLLNGPCPTSPSGFLTGAWKVPADQVSALLQGHLYVNFHTKLNPNGEIRGQLLP